MTSRDDFLYSIRPPPNLVCYGLDDFVEKLPCQLMAGILVVLRTQQQPSMQLWAVVVVVISTLLLFRITESLKVTSVQ